MNASQDENSDVKQEGTAALPPLPEYRCRHISGDAPDWAGIAAIELADVAAGTRPRMRTAARSCWSDTTLYIRFECEDDCVVSPYTKRDDPLYEADVVECFIDTAGMGRAYYEFNLSPHNVVFDSYITNNPGEPTAFHPEWDAQQLVTSVVYASQPKRQVIYEYAIAFSDLKATPNTETEWRINLFRIDEDELGTREYTAWSPTGAVNFHVPERFGTFRFTKE
ncbi:carbohydrate-binding family 9-like protein [Paenibacillus apiarius]|uniref:carbohydrate-binding family 9-like protein n=1 Tax=Paenibacillus apiarius TaxID=46240 RepID=UPI003B3BA80F